MKKILFLLVALCNVYFWGAPAASADTSLSFSDEKYVLGDVQLDGYTVNTFILSGKELENSVRQIDITYSPGGSSFTKDQQDRMIDALFEGLKKRNVRSKKGGYCAGGYFVVWEDDQDELSGFFIRKFTDKAIIEFSYVDDAARFEKARQAGLFEKWLKDMSLWFAPKHRELEVSAE